VYGEKTNLKMKNNPIYNTLVLVCIMFCSFQCNKQPCICDFSPVHSIKVKIINQQNQNLLFGTNAIYQIDSIQLLQQKNNFNINNAAVRKDLSDSNNVEFDFYTPAAKSYLYYNQQTDTDSIEIKWLTKTGKCCGNSQEYSVVDSVKFNNTVITGINGVYYFIK